MNRSRHYISRLNTYCRSTCRSLFVLLASVACAWSLACRLVISSFQNRVSVTGQDDGVVPEGQEGWGLSLSVRFQSCWRSGGGRKRVLGILV